MKKKPKATLAQHVGFALAVAKIEAQILDLERAARPYTTKHQRTKLWSAYNLIGEFKSRMEDLMFRDHPELGDEWLHLYFGTASPAETEAMMAEVEAEVGGAVAT